MSSPTPVPAIDKANLKKIFGDYINIESKAAMRNEGSGFGTILSRQLIEMMGGKLQAESPSGLSGTQGYKSIIYNRNIFIRQADQESFA